MALERARARREQDNQSCCFLRLPPELRVQIYREAFSRPSSLPEREKALLSEEWNFEYAFVSARVLIQSCRAIRAEAEVEFWSSQSIELRDFSSAGIRHHLTFIGRLSSKAVASLRRIYFIFCDPPRHTC